MLSTQINKSVRSHSQHTQQQSHLRTLKEQYPICQRERMIILSRVNLGAFCDYGYLFGAARYSQSRNERKYRSLLGYENTCRPHIIPCSLSMQHSVIGFISTSLTPPPLPPLKFHLVFTTFSNSFVDGSSEERKNICHSCLESCLCGVWFTITFGTRSLSYLNRKQRTNTNTNELYL